MLDPISLGAIGAVLGAVRAGMANEAGKWAWDSAGDVVRRIVGREVGAPNTSSQLDEVARLVYERVHDDPQLARAWILFAQRVRVPCGLGTRAQRAVLPDTPRFVTTRRKPLRSIDKEATRNFNGRPRLALLHGPQGIGATTLAVQWGLGRQDRFPDGQLYVDLRAHGSDGATVSALLRQLGLPDEEIPPSTAERVELFHCYLVGKRLLLVLDHAKSPDQLISLLTSAPDVVTLVVARHPLAGLDALCVPVGPLARRDGLRLLTGLAGKPGTRAARAELPAVLNRCAGSPYALRAAARRLAAAPLAQVHTVAFSHVQTQDPVSVAVEDSYRLLAPDTARLYRLAGLYRWPAFDAAAAARAADLDETEAARLLEELADSLLLEHADAGRYRYRPVVRAHAVRTAVATDGMGVCVEAVGRTVEHYLHFAEDAAQAALPESWRVPAGTALTSYESPGTAVAALDAEVHNLVQAAHAAQELRDWDTVIRLCRALWPLQLKAGHHDVLLPVLRVGVRTVDEQFPGTRMAGSLHAQLAHTLTELKLWDEAESEVLSAVRDERVAGHLLGQASAVEFLGLLRLSQWRFRDAYACFREAHKILDGIGFLDEGHADVRRARALLHRHRGRAMRGMGLLHESREWLERALAHFENGSEVYNTARVRTDLAETHLRGGEFAKALPLIDKAIKVLEKEEAVYHLAHLRAMRKRCLNAE